jgi:hypothetical protein
MIDQSTKTVPELIAELREELKEFVATRVALLRSEISAKMRSYKLAAPGVVMGLVLVVTGWLLFSAFLVCAIANGFSGIAWRYPIALIIVGAVYCILGFVALTFAWQQIKETGVKPEHTIRLLKEDRVWLQTEVKTQS